MGVLIAVPSGIALALAITTVLSQMVAGVAIAGVAGGGVQDAAPRSV